MKHIFQNKLFTTFLIAFCSLFLPIPSLAQLKSIEKNDSLVDIAYSLVPRIMISSAISSINASTVSKNSVTSVEEALNGTISGLYSIKSGGQKFGTQNFNFYIRGKATVATATPLILVDDVEGNINLMDFNEVESVTVLKDAASLAIYGMRGANGVILIKTKRGNELRNSISLDFRVGVQSPLKVKSAVNAYDYTCMYNEALINDGSTGIYNPNNYVNNINTFKYPDVNFGNLFLKNESLSQQYNFTARGGNKTAKYFCLVGYTKQDGLFALPNNIQGVNQKSYERYNFRSNMDVKLGAGFDMSVDVLAAFDYNRSPWMDAASDANVSSNTLINSILNTPANSFPVTNADGSLGGTSIYRSNPQGILLRGLRTDEHKLLTSRVKLIKDLNFITPGLKAYVMYHFENYNSSYKAKYKNFAVNGLDTVSGLYTKYNTDDTKTTTTGGETSGYYRDNNFHAAMTYDKKFSTNDISALLLFNQTTSSTGGDVPDHRYQAISGRALYGFEKRYYAELSVSYQGSNNYQRGKRYGFFPAAALSWVASEESFLKESKTIDYLKFRASYGVNGNDQVGGNRFAYRQAWYSGSGYGFGNPNTTGDGSYEGTLSNTNATWEKAYKSDLGVDFKILNGDLAISTDIFYERREDIMVDQANLVPSLLGIALPLLNGGTIENKGVEASFNYNKNIDKLTVNFGGNFLFAKNKIIDLQELPYQYDWLFRKGNSIDTQYGFVANGIYNSTNELIGEPASAYKTIGTGDIRYANQNPADDQVINELDKVAIGNTFPEMIFGVNFSLKYEAFDVSCFGEGSARNNIYVRPSSYSVYAKDTRWQNSNSSGNYPKLSISDTHNTQTSTFWRESGNFFSIRSVEFGYMVPALLVKKVSLSSVRLYVNANNLITFSSDREGRDPEALAAGFSEYPLLRTLLVGLSIKL
jgi:TonB-linked SusC/RagA family outer membrane protein